MSWGSILNRWANKALLLGVVLLVGALMLAGPSHAVAIVSVDMDPSSPGVQSTRTVQQGDMFDVDIFIEGVTNLSAFEFDLSFNGSVLTANDVVDGGFLADPVFVVEKVIGASAIMFAESTLGLNTASGDGALATASFTADAAGMTTLDLSNVALSAPFGVSIEVGSVDDGELTVESSSELSAPPALTFLLFGALATVIATRRRH